VTSLLTAASKRPAPAPFIKVRGNAWPDDFEDDWALWRHPFAIDAEGPVWLYVQMYELPEDCRGPHKHKWCASLIAVSPFFATNHSVVDALRSCEDSFEESWQEMDNNSREMAVCEALVDYGVKATLVEKTSTRAKGPFKGCATEAAVANMMFGVYLDRQANAIGNDGWNFLRGDYGYGKQTPREPTLFQKKVVRWLDRYYPGRRAYQASQK